MEKKLNQTINISPQPGPQTDFLKSSADIVIYGGAAGGGKTYAILMEALRHYENEKFGAVIFRRNTTQIRNEGGLWDEAQKMYIPLGFDPSSHVLLMTAPSGMRVRFAHLEHDDTVYKYQGAQIPLICFDELTSFTRSQFIYMMSRNRSMSGVPGYIRATCNPDAESWVRELIDWWIGADGFPIKERSGKFRWFIRSDGDGFIFADTKKELIEKYGPETMPKSLTFIPSNIQDNKILLEKDPSYLASLKAQSRVERERLLEGNWNIKKAAGNYFKKEWFPVVDTLPAGFTGSCRYWDRASTEPHEGNSNPDYTVGLALYKYPDGRMAVADIRRDRKRPIDVENMVLNTAKQDGYNVGIGIEQDPGQAGQADADNYVRLLRGFNVRVNRVTKDKITRALAVSAQAERGNIMIVKGSWNADFLSECENFPPDTKKDNMSQGKDDQVDALSGAFNMLVGSASVFDNL